MALTVFQTFEAGSATVDVASVAGTAAIVSNWSHSGSYSLRCNPVASTAGSAVIRGIGSNGSNGGNFSGTQQATINFYFKIDLLPASGEAAWLTMRTNNTPGVYRCYIAVTSAGNFKAYDSGGVVIGTGTFTITPGTTYFANLHYSGVSGSGSLTFAVGTSAATATTDITGSGLQLGGVSNTAVVVLGRSADVALDANPVDFYYDDVIGGQGVLDIQTLDYKGAMLRPVANGSIMQWTAGTGTSYATVNNSPFDGTSYIQSTGTAGDTAYFRMTPTAAAGISINAKIIGAKVVTSVRDAVVTTNSFQVLISSNGSVVQNSATNNTTGSFDFAGLLALADPATGAPWTPAALNTVQVGVTEGSAVSTRVGDIGLEVMYIPAPMPSTAGNFFQFM